MFIMQILSRITCNRLPVASDHHGRHVSPTSLSCETYEYHVPSHRVPTSDSAYVQHIPHQDVASKPTWPRLQSVTLNSWTSAINLTDVIHHGSGMELVESWTIFDTGNLRWWPGRQEGGFGMTLVGPDHGTLDCRLGHSAVGYIGTY